MSKNLFLNPSFLDGSSLSSLSAASYGMILETVTYSSVKAQSDTQNSNTRHFHICEYVVPRDNK